MMLEDFGLEPERFRIEWIASRKPEVADVMTDMTEACGSGPSRIIPGGKREKIGAKRRQGKKP